MICVGEGRGKGKREKGKQQEECNRGRHGERLPAVSGAGREWCVSD